MYHDFMLPTIDTYEDLAVKRFVEPLNYPNFMDFEDVK